MGVCSICGMQWVCVFRGVKYMWGCPVGVEIISKSMFIICRIIADHLSMTGETHGPALLWIHGDRDMKPRQMIDLLWDRGW